jgi:hypothetical protein
MGTAGTAEVLALRDQAELAELAELATATRALREMLVPATGTVVTARVMAEAMALRDLPDPTAVATPVRARTAPTETLP